MLISGTRYTAVAALAVLCLWGPSARADESPDPLDLRCLVVAIQMQNSSNADLKASAPAVTMFYLGRLQPRGTTTDLFEPLAKVLTSWTAADFSSEAQRCGHEIQQAGLDLKSVGQRLVQRGQQMNEKAASGN